MTAELANVEANLLKAERLTRVAFQRGARWVILPEFFTSAIAFHPEMANATRAMNGTPAQLLRKLAREGNAFVGGSFLAWRDGNAYNSFVLALPDGNTRRHDKDYPSYWEACYYVGGSDNGIISTPDGNVGAALCYEFVRSKTAARLKGRVDMVVGGSCWWGVEDTVPANDLCADGSSTFRKTHRASLHVCSVSPSFTPLTPDVLKDFHGPDLLLHFRRRTSVKPKL